MNGLMDVMIVVGLRNGQGPSLDPADRLIEEQSYQWAQQWVAADPTNRHLIEVCVTQQQIRDDPTAVRRRVRDEFNVAVQTAGSGGNVILSVGHGGAHDADIGFLDFGPSRIFRIDDEIVNYSPHQRESDRRTVAAQNLSPDITRTELQNEPQQYSPDVIDAVDRLERARFYEGICRRFPRNIHLNKIIFLTCNVGQSSNFVQQMSNDLGVDIDAPTVRVGIGWVPQQSNQQANQQANLQANQQANQQVNAPRRARLRLAGGQWSQENIPEGNDNDWFHANAPTAPSIRRDHPSGLEFQGEHRGHTPTPRAGQN